MTNTFIPFRQKPAARPPITIQFTIAADHAPALRSAVDEISTLVGHRLEGPHVYEKEQALTYAAAALGALRAAVNTAIPTGARHYA